MCQGTEVIEGIISCKLEYRNPVKRISFNTGAFKRMSNLGFLHLADVDIVGRFEQTFEDLRWLRWDECHSTSFPSIVFPPNLVILVLHTSKIRTMWELNMVFESLKTLDMSYSEDLTTTPDFTKLPCLEILNLRGCISLEEVHISIGSSFDEACSLRIEWLCEAKKSSSTITKLRALEVLLLDYCSSLQALPVELGNIKSLKELKVRGLTVLKLPDSIGSLGKLVELDIRSNRNLETLPDTICSLRALVFLNIKCFSGLRALPIEFGKIKSLKQLYMSDLTVTELPDSIGDLYELVELSLTHNKNLRNLPDTICSLRSLEILDISDNERLKTLPDNFWNLMIDRE